MIQRPDNLMYIIKVRNKNKYNYLHISTTESFILPADFVLKIFT